MATHTPYKALVNGGNPFDSQPAISLKGGKNVTVDFIYYTGGTPDSVEGSALLTTLDLAGRLALNDIIYLCRIPKGATITDYYLDIPDIESSTGALTLELGLASSGNAGIFLTASQLGRVVGTVLGSTAVADSISGAVANALPHGPINVVDGSSVPVSVASGFPGDDVLQIKCSAASTAAGTTTAGVAIRGWVQYHCRGRGVW